MTFPPRARLESLVAEVAAEVGAASGGPDGAYRPRVIEETDPTGELTARARQLQRALWERGLGWVGGPESLGGCGGTHEDAALLDRLCDRAGLPSRNPLLVGLHIVAPAVLAYGSDELRQRVLPRLFAGELVGCQLFSEPGAGSDLAGVRTRAVRDGDDWVVSGQKVWTSQAHVADIGEALVRTDPEASKHGGLTMMLVDMRAPGVTVRPLRQMTGDAAFNEVFLDEVRVPARDVVGEPGQGWQVAAASLSSERGSMAGPQGPLSAAVREAWYELAAERLAAADTDVADETARAVAAVVAAREVLRRQEASVSAQKMLLVRAVDLVGSSATALLGDRAWITGDGGDDGWAEFALGAPGIHLAGGTDEIQRTLIAQRDLGLPRARR